MKNASFVQSNIFLDELFRNINEGNIAKAPFNRQYAWTEKDVLMFFESIKVGYPIGNIITWVPEDDQSKDWDRRLGPVITENRPKSYLVDGHNRLATIAYSMSTFDEIEKTIPVMTKQEKEVWGNGKMIVFNADTTEISFMDQNLIQTTPNIIPLGELGKNYFGYLRYHHKNFHLDNENINNNLNDMSNNIREAKMVNLVMFHTSPKATLDAFLHLAKVGQPITEQDIENAEIWLDLNQTPGMKF